MQLYVLCLCAFYAIAKAYVRFWLYRPVYERPPFGRHNETLRLVELAAVLALIASFFFLINIARLSSTCLIIGGLLLYDGLLRQLFMTMEIRRLVATSSRWTYETAARQVRKRARVPIAT